MPQYNLGWIPSPLDIQDYKLAIYLPMKYNVTGNMRWPYNGRNLDQNGTNHCVGFAGAGWGISAPVEDNFTNEDGHRLYRGCKIIDNDPSGEEGTNIRALAKTLQKEGMIKNYAFAYSTDEISWWILNKGPVIVGTEWTDGMFSPDKNNIIHPTGPVVGGHGYFLNEKTSDNYYTIHNSWDGWGINSEAKISIADFAILFRHGGEAIATVEVPITAIPVTPESSCLEAILKLLENPQAFFNLIKGENHV
jgi:hypothetical protein